MAWFQLNVPAAPTDPLSYSPNGAPSCSGDQQICAIQADEGNPGRPDITPELIEEMVIALNTHSNGDNVLLKA